MEKYKRRPLFALERNISSILRFILSAITFTSIISTSIYIQTPHFDGSALTILFHLENMRLLLVVLLAGASAVVSALPQKIESPKSDCDWCWWTCDNVGMCIGVGVPIVGNHAPRLMRNLWIDPLLRSLQLWRLPATGRILIRMWKERRIHGRLSSRRR